MELDRHELASYISSVLLLMGALTKDSGEVTIPKKEAALIEEALRESLKMIQGES